MPNTKPKTNRIDFSNPKHRAAHLAGVRTPENRAKRAKIMKARWKDPEERAKLSKAIKASWKKRRAEGTAKPKAVRKASRRSNETMTEYRSRLMKARWKDPAMRKKLLAGRTKAQSVPKRVIDNILDRFGKNVRKVLRDSIQAELARLS